MTDADNVVRGFVREKATGALFAVERIANSKQFTAAVRVTAATCRHQLEKLDIPAITPEAEAEGWFKFPGDYEAIDIPCSDPVHLLAGIGEQERTCKKLQREYDLAHEEAKEAKRALDMAIAELRLMVGNATDPKELPLLDAPAV